MKITMNDKDITKLSSTTYSYDGSIQSDEELIIVVPAKMILDVSGHVQAKGSIVVKGGDLYADGNIISNGSIICNGELCSVDGSISAVTEIRAGELVSAKRGITCTNGDVNAPAIQCDTLSCNNYDDLVRSATLTLGNPNGGCDNMAADNWDEHEKMM